MGEDELNNEWEAKGLKVSILTKRARESLTKMSSQIEDDFMAAILGSSNGVSFTIQGSGAVGSNLLGGLPTGSVFERVTISYAEARELAEWILKQLE
jgi:hypothetical protein